MAKIKFEHCTYSDGFCHDFEAVQVRWADLKAAGFSGDGSDSDEIIAALLDSGAPAWVQDASGWVDEIGWGLIWSPDPGRGGAMMNESAVKALRESSPLKIGG